MLIWATSSDLGTIARRLQIVSLVLLIVSLAFIGLKIWSWRNQEYLVTTRRVIKAEGIFNKQMGDSSLEKVNDARLTQSWLGRIFDYGTLDILTASEMAETGMVNDFPMLAEPVRFKVAMLTRRRAWSSRTWRRLPPSAGAPPPDDAARGADGAARRLLPVSEVRADGAQRPRRPAPPAAPRRRGGRRRRVEHVAPRWRASPGCATRASSPPRSTRPRGASCWSACRWSRSAGARCPTGSTVRSLSTASTRPPTSSGTRMAGEPVLAMPRLAFVLGSGLGGVVDLLEPDHRADHPVSRDSARARLGGGRARRRAGDRPGGGGHRG